MAVVYIADQGASVSKKGDRLYVYKGAMLQKWFHTKDISSLILVGNITLSSQTLTYLLKHRIDTVFLTYYGRYKGRLISEFGKNIALRISQFTYLAELPNREELAALYIIGKLCNMQKHLAMRKKKNAHPALADAILKNSAILERLQSGSMDLAVLRGFEGIASKNYFAAFPYLIFQSQFPFTGRNRRPPKDEVNSLLSLGYTFLMNQVMSAANICGLDPYYGALHDLCYGRQSLVLDIMEEFRPLVDNLIITLINRKEIRPEHFRYNLIPDDECEPEDLDQDSRLLPVSLTQDGMKILITAFSRMVNSKFRCTSPQGEWLLKDIFVNQIRKLIRHFDRKSTYESFRWQ
ncbi:MAG TPA: CRISPR-associated endonuclease Cas1 [Candidatus Cloacimonadota bacterium]|nr:CRISPR-associated endonuclease Cas1 [Candidatus Cloacimonadota bacterium]